MDKTYAAGRLRRLRESRSMSQADLARLLAISPSYVNLMEHNSRPLTVPVLLKLTESFGVDLDFFAPKDTARLVADVREVVTDNAGESVSAAEIDELATNSPGIANTLVRLHRRYREVTDSLAAVAGEQVDAAVPDAAARQPHEEVRDYFYQRQNYVAELDEHAEARAGEWGLQRGTRPPPSPATCATPTTCAWCRTRRGTGTTSTATTRTARCCGWRPNCNPGRPPSAWPRRSRCSRSATSSTIWWHSGTSATR